MPFKLPADPAARKQVLAAMLRLRAMTPAARKKVLAKHKPPKPKE